MVAGPPGVYWRLRLARDATARCRFRRRRTRRPRSAHLFIAALTIATATCVITAATGRDIAMATTIVTLCMVGGLVGGSPDVAGRSRSVVGHGALFGCSSLLTMAPTVALWASRIRPPHFGSITGSDLFRRRDGMPVDAVVPSKTTP